MTGFRHSGQSLRALGPVLIFSAQSTQHRCPHDSVPDNQTAPSLSKPSKQTGHVSCSRTWTGAASASKSIWQCPITGHWALPKANNSWYLARSKQCWASSIIHLVFVVESGQPQYHPHPGGKDPLGQGDLVRLVHPRRHPHHLLWSHLLQELPQVVWSMTYCWGWMYDTQLSKSLGNCNALQVSAQQFWASHCWGYFSSVLVLSVLDLRPVGQYLSQFCWMMWRFSLKAVWQLFQLTFPICHNLRSGGKIKI